MLRDWTNPLRGSTAIDLIEKVLESIVDGLLNDKNEIGITLKSRRQISRRKSPSNVQMANESETPTRRLCFPGKTADDAWRFGQSSSCASVDFI